MSDPNDDMSLSLQCPISTMGTRGLGKTHLFSEHFFARIPPISGKGKRFPLYFGFSWGRKEKNCQKRERGKGLTSKCANDVFQTFLLFFPSFCKNKCK